MINFLRFTWPPLSGAAINGGIYLFVHPYWWSFAVMVFCFLAAVPAAYWAGESKGIRETGALWRDTFDRSRALWQRPVA